LWKGELSEQEKSGKNDKNEERKWKRSDWIALAALIVSLLSLVWHTYNSWTILQLTIEQQRLEHFEPWVEISSVAKIKLIGHQIYHETVLPVRIEVASPHPYRIEVMNQTLLLLQEDVGESNWLLPEYLNQTGVRLLEATSFIVGEGARSHTLCVPVEAVLGVSQDAPPEMDVGSFEFKIGFLDITSRKARTIDVRADVVWAASLLLDLTAEFVNLPEELVAGRTYEITIRVKNIGRTDTEGFNVELSANRDIVEKKEIGGLLSGASMTIPLQWSPGEFSPGDYTLTLTVDPEDWIDELDETNNVAAVEVTVSPKPREVIWYKEWGPIIAGAVTIVIVVIIAVVITRERR